jgi:hypothetical protein
LFGGEKPLQIHRSLDGGHVACIADTFDEPKKAVERLFKELPSCEPFGRG